MKIPSLPQKGGSVEHAIREIIAFIRSSQVVSVRGGLLRTSPNGTTIQINGGRGGAAAAIFPFEITSGGTTLRAAAGAVNAFNVAETTLEDPANGTWYLEVEVTINDTTGVITGVTAEWVTAATSNTATTFHKTIGQSFVAELEVTPGSNINYTYGNYVVILHGTQTNKWGAVIF